MSWSGTYEWENGGNNLRCPRDVQIKPLDVPMRMVDEAVWNLTKRGIGRPRWIFKWNCKARSFSEQYIKI